MNDLYDYPDGATPLDPDEKEGLLLKNIQTRSELDELENRNIIIGMRWAKKQPSKDILSEKFVRDLHTKLFNLVWSWAGTFRLTEKNIGDDPRQVSIKLRDLLDDTKYWVEHNTYPPKELAVRFHHRLVKIHPFPNGNGRHSRIMADTILVNVLNEEAIDWSSHGQLDKASDHRRNYILALRAADAGGFDLLLEFVGA